MTIKIEQEAIMRVLGTARSSLARHPITPRKPPSTGIPRRPPSSPPCPSVPPRPPSVDRCPDLLSLDSDEDCISLSSCGSSASSCVRRGRSPSPGAGARRVSFATQLVTDVKTRPRTKDSEKRLLFYTQSETDRFRQVYREERSLSPDFIHPDSYEEPPPSEMYGRRRISRVVVEHNDSLETFYDFDELSPYPQKGGGASMNEVFFDNDSFWSGSITWY